MARVQPNNGAAAWGVAVLVALAAAWGVNAAQQQPAGKITYVQGKALRNGGQGWKRLEQGSAVFEGDQLETRKRARLEATLRDGSVLRLGQSSKLRLKMAKTQGKRRKKVKARLFIGRVWASVTSFFGGKDNDFEVETDNAVAGVRGTRFSASTSEQGDTTVKVYEGKVLVSNEPTYQVKGHSKDNRVEVAGPQEISQDEWESLVAGAMQFIRVSKSGAMSEPEGFETAQSDNAWEAWNLARDAERD